MSAGSAAGEQAQRFRLHRCGVLNVWQYDEQVFECAGGRLLLRGANGAGKSKTLEMLLPFTLDGDKLRITASGRHHTSLLWLMTDGYDGTRTGYLWVEFARAAPGGPQEFLTCGVGVRASSTARTATTWFFTSPRRVGGDLQLEDAAGPLSRERCRDAVQPDGHFFDQARAYKHHVGRVLFGLEPAQYDELLRLLYWLRQPQVGEDIEPAKLAEQLAQALPPVDDDAVRSAGDTFDELAAFGEQIDRRRRAAEAIAAFAAVYAAYAAAATRKAAADLLDAHREQSRRVAAVTAAGAALDAAESAVLDTTARLGAASAELEAARVRQRELESSPEARSHQRLLDLDARAGELRATAESAADAAATGRRRAEDSERLVAEDATRLMGDLDGFAQRAQEVLAAAERAGAPLRLAPEAGLVVRQLDGSDAAEAVLAWLDVHEVGMGALAPALGELAAAIHVVDDARQVAEAAARRREADDRRVAEAETRAERERGLHADAATAAREAVGDLLDRLRAWQEDPRGLPLVLPEIDAETVTTIATLARQAAEPEITRLEGERAAAAADRLEAERALEQQRRRRAAVEAERDAAPRGPGWVRTARDASDGAPLWRLVDFAPSLSESDRAGLEAGLEASGLLDAWVRADGAVLDADRLDSVLPLGPPIDGAEGLGSLLVADVPADCPVPVDVVAGVLGRVAVRDSAGSGDGAFVSVDGGWRLGPLTGRAAKPSAQYVGATARAQERARRLAEIDAEVERLTAERSAAADRELVSVIRLQAVRDWLASVPSPHSLLTAWTLLDERARSAQQAESEVAAADEASRRSRAEAAARHADLVDLAARHELPVTADGLAARREGLRDLAERLHRHIDGGRPLADRVHRWVSDWTRWRDDEAQSVALAEDAESLDRAARGAAERLRTLRDTLGASVDELQRRLTQARSDIEDADQALRDQRRAVDAARDLRAEARTTALAAQSRREEHVPVVVACAGALAAAADVPGLLRSALGRDVDEDELATLGLARTIPDGEVPRRVISLARTFGSLPEPSRRADQAAVLAAWQDSQSSDAADHEPRLVPGPGDVLAALGRDDTGERPVAVLAERLAAAVARDRDLLTERERALFEEHLIGDLGEELRRRRLEATELVEAMNRLLGGVTTSQGIRVSLRWQLRDDVPSDARRAMDLLGRSVGALLPSERGELRDALHRLIEASRAESPEASYADHLARALDYRRWHAFRVRYTRPESAGEWQDLHRRSPLSQGEQKVVCYLPLFAAAAAHFTSLAGAAPHAPRLVLLDDAFPKIDVRTHPLLFGLLVAFDLDFVVTSERLWGDYATVPALSIYEALRDPNERGVAQYQYQWDGSRLQAVGA
ncbi:MAG TPA: TIGR02680 family protein [Actinomycetes bacterium]